MNEQNTLAGKTAADLVQSIAAALFGDAGAGITDLIALANRVQAATGKQQVGEPEIEFQARLMDVKTDLPTENWRHSPTYDENPGRGTHYWVQFRKRYIYYTPPAQAVDLGPVRAALQAAEALCACCASIDAYSRSELNAFGQNMRSQFRDALAVIDGKASAHD